MYRSVGADLRDADGQHDRSSREAIAGRHRKQSIQKDILRMAARRRSYARYPRPLAKS